MWTLPDLRRFKLNNIHLQPSKKVYPPLAKMLFSNLYFTDRIIYSNVRKHKIYIPLEVFANIFDLSHDWPLFKPYEQDDNFNYKTNASSYLKILKSGVTLSTHSRFYAPWHSFDLLCHILFPRKSNLSHLIRSDVATVWMITNKIETDVNKSYRHQ